MNKNINLICNGVIFSITFFGTWLFMVLLVLVSSERLAIFEKGMVGGNIFWEFVVFSFMLVALVSIVAVPFYVANKTVEYFSSIGEKDKHGKRNRR